MKTTLLQATAAALALSGNVAAKVWYTEKTYDATNFFDEFSFWESKFGTGDYNDIDPAKGHVNYLSKDNALSQGLAKYKDNEVYLGVDTTSVLKGAYNPGRPSVRLESKQAYNRGLFIARFSHLPQATCGLWPAFWTYGKDWPNDGEIDIYEGWNDATFNGPALHTGNSAKYGQCKISNDGQTGVVKTDNCDNTYSNEPLQYQNQGCAVNDYAAPYGAANGGVYAMEWTSDSIKLYSWSTGNAPANVNSDSPDTDTWGQPNVYLKNSMCNVDGHFSNQKLVINLDFCGEPAGFDSEWSKSCKAKTNTATCIDYISQNPSAFVNAFFQIKDIRVFGTNKPSTSSTAVSSTASSSVAGTSSTLATTLATTTPSSSGASSAAASSSVASQQTTRAATTPSSSFSSLSSSFWGNQTTSVRPNSIPTTAVPTTSVVPMTTSTVSTTQIRTVTQCPPSVTNCPANGSGGPWVVTETIALYTTVCPVTQTGPAPTASVPTKNAPGGQGPSTITTAITQTYTVTKCPAYVVDCPIGKVTTGVITTTIVQSGDSSKPTGGAVKVCPTCTASNVQKPTVTANDGVKPTSSPYYPGGNSTVPIPTGKGGNSGNTNSGASPSSGPKTAGASGVTIGGALAVAAAMVASTLIMI
uniref:GH16 domain-containing protein n=1 Tax=Bionectria ochroleuca TaxID=29856 RepID=A0A8H7NEI5_BIOOC